jgi:hypothetical protein
MQTYTILFRRGETLGVQAVSFQAANAERAVLLARQFSIEDPCELWTDGQFVCSLQMVGKRGGHWMVASRALSADIEVKLETGS